MPVKHEAICSDLRPKIVNLGSLCFDRVYHVPALVQSGQTLRASSTALFPGGKGLNQSLAARRAGARVHHVGCVGHDGEELRAVLVDAGVNVDGLRTQADLTTAHAVIQLTPQGENAIVIVGGSNFSIQSTDVDCALDALVPGDWLLLQNELNDLAEVLEQAHLRGAHICMNLAPYSETADAYALQHAHMLIVNETEAAGLTRCTEPEDALLQLRKRCPDSTVVLTLGEFGLLYDAGAGLQRMSAYTIQAVDGTAAGDAFIGYLLARLQQGDDLPLALRMGSAAGALAASRAGAATSIPELHDVQRLVDSARSTQGTSNQRWHPDLSAPGLRSTP